MTRYLAPRGRLGVAFDYLQILIGALLVAAGTNLFFVPNNVVSGGVVGVGIIAHALFNAPVGVVSLALNIPLLAIGWKWAGGVRFFARTAFAVAVMSAAIDLSAPFLHAPTQDRLLVICYGGLLDGLGMGLVFRGRGTTGGTDIIARLAHRYLGLGIGQTLLAVNVLIFAVAGFFFGAEAVMVALALAFVSARTLDTVQAGFSVSRQAMIVSARPEEVRDTILHNLGRGVTVLEGRGGFTGDPRPILWVVVASHEVGRLKRRVAEVDPKAFVAISTAQEVLGEGFAPTRPED